jgi:hypothetical protein
MLSDRQKVEGPEGRGLLAKYIISLGSAGPEDLAIAERLFESISPGANANKLIRWLDHQLYEYLNRIDFTLPDGVLATGVYPLRSLRAVSVPRQNGVLLLLATGSMEWLEYVVSLTLMTEPTSKNEKIRFLNNKAVQEFVGSPSRLPATKELDGPSWNSMRESIHFGVTWAEWFLLCHEYAHHALGHFKNAHAERYSDTRGEFQVVQFSHVQEYEADLWAMSILWASYRLGHLHSRQRQVRRLPLQHHF